MIIVGIDPSLVALGFAESSPTGISATTFHTKPGSGSLFATRERIRYLVSRALRASAPRIDLTVIEKPIIPRQHAGGAVLDRAWLYGLLVDQFLTRGPVVGVQQAVRAKYASGSGNAKKPEVLAAVREAFPGIPIRDDNAADALALVAMGARHLGEPLDGLASKKQESAMAAVAWPPIERNN